MHEQIGVSPMLFYLVCIKRSRLVPLILRLDFSSLIFTAILFYETVIYFKDQGNDTLPIVGEEVTVHNIFTKLRSMASRQRSKLLSS